MPPLTYFMKSPIYHSFMIELKPSGKTINPETYGVWTPQLMQTPLHNVQYYQQ